MRIEVLYRNPDLDGRAHRSLEGLKALVPGVESLALVDVYLLEGLDALGSADWNPETATRVFADTVAQELHWGGGAGSRVAHWDSLFEVAFRPGVTDTTAITAREALENRFGTLPAETVVQTARQFLVSGGPAGLSPDDCRTVARYLHNPLIEDCLVLAREEWELQRQNLGNGQFKGAALPEIRPHTIAPSPREVLRIPLAHLDAAGLEKLSKERLLALTVPEMQAIQDYYNRPETRALREKLGIGADPTDVELEMLAQTWSEHCKHKIFAARINYDDGSGKTRTIDSLFKTFIRQTTMDLWEKRPFLRSVFTDNAGVVAFDEDTLLCFKAETHNSPSALDPYGGAITGIVGVNRDVLGTGKGARPIFNTNVLCFGPPDTPADSLPAGLLHPRRVMRGVHHGIVDGGNQSGIPTVAGAFLFDESYVGKPLVFCGTGGILPARIHGEDAYIHHIDAGDLAVMAGGRIGKDGIHGATFSSLALDESSPTSAVQIGDPIIQKRMTDFLLAARDQGLYKGITDNGAGGLSSSLGEMAESSGGLRLYLDQCPLKYPGLAPWEILVSESQERMSLSVAPEQWEAFAALARDYHVEVSIVGEFTDSGLVELFHDKEPVGLLSMEFLHDGLPQMQLEARWKEPALDRKALAGQLQKALEAEASSTSATAGQAPWNSLLHRLLADPTAASKEDLVRQYDHEVQGRSVIKPFTGTRDQGPSDGAVLQVHADSTRGITVTHGVCPRVGDTDPRAMAMNAVDEAYRAHIALGGHPDEASVLDNFCWPDPVLSPHCPDGDYKLAQLVKTNEGLQEACLAYGLPLISGKDSMKNDANLDGRKVSIRPTLLISLMGFHPDVRRASTTDFLKPGDRIYLLGQSSPDLGGSLVQKHLGLPADAAPVARPGQALELYRLIHTLVQKGLFSTVHDLSDGGLASALAESAMGGELGATVTLDSWVSAEKTRLLQAGTPWLGSDESLVAALLFGEAPSRFLVSLPAERASELEQALAGLAGTCHDLGAVVEKKELFIVWEGRTLVDATLESLETAWTSLKEGGEA